MGPMTLDVRRLRGDAAQRARFHTWDIEVVHAPSATLPTDAAALVVDNLELVARFTARPTGDTRTIRVGTTNPERVFTLELTPDAATMLGDVPGGEADLELPAEAFARLVYGRLDPKHTPPGQHGDALDQLRQVFPGP